jgi:hypothetical protein
MAPIRLPHGHGFWAVAFAFMVGMLMFAGALAAGVLTGLRPLLAQASEHNSGLPPPTRAQLAPT